jgi:heat shock protein HslJ
MVRSQKDVFVLLMLLLAMSTVACGSSVKLDAQDLIGSEWTLTSLNGEELAKDTNITLTFEEERLGGFAGCNHYGALYTTDKKGTLEIPAVESTQQGCLEPEGVLEQESAYINILMTADALRVVEDQLELLDESGEVVLAYIKREPFEMDPSQLEGVEWQLLSMGVEPLIEGTLISISFSGGEMQGHAGCRDFHGRYEAAGDQIRVTFIEMLGEVCGDEALLLQEARFTDVLELSTHYQVVQGQLTLFTATGEEALFAGGR